jgi:hypothetical protein
LVALSCCCEALLAAPPRPAARVIKTPMWTQTPAGDPIAAKDLRAAVEGSPAKVLALRGPGDDLMVLIVLDLTGDLPLAAAAKEGLKEQVARLPPNAYVGLLRAQDGLSVLADPTPDRTAVNQQIENLPVSGKAELLDTVQTAEEIADAILAKSAVRVVVLYITDSDVRNYREDFTNPVINPSDTHDLSRRFPETLIQEKISKLSADLLRRQAPLFLVHLRYSSERLNQAYQNGLKQLAEATGGTGVFCQSSAEIPEAIQRVFALIASHYSVALALPDRAGKTVHVQLEAKDGRALNYRSRFAVKGR